MFSLTPPYTCNVSFVKAIVGACQITVALFSHFFIPNQCRIFLYLRGVHNAFCFLFPQRYLTIWPHIAYSYAFLALIAYSTNLCLSHIKPISFAYFYFCYALSKRKVSMKIPSFLQQGKALWLWQFVKNGSALRTKIK